MIATARWAMSLKITSVTYRLYPQPDYFGHRAVCGRQNRQMDREGFVKRCVLSWLLLLLVAGSLQAEQVPSTPASGTIFLWLAGGISSARIQRLALTRNEALNPSCHATTQCTRALQKAGADAGLIQSLGRQSSDRSSDRNRDRK